MNTTDDPAATNADPPRFVDDWEDAGALCDPGVARAVLAAWFEAHRWVHRRKEQVDLVDERSGRVRVSIDYTTPSDRFLLIDWMDDNEVCLVPVDAFDKEPLHAFDLRDRWDAPVPTLTRRQNGMVAYHGILGTAAANTSHTITDHVAELLSAVARDRPPRSLHALDELRSDGSPAARDLAANEGFMATAEFLARNFLLIAVTPGFPGHRDVLKWSYERELGTDLDLRSPRQRRRSELALEPSALYYPALTFAFAESYHFEATAPPGTHFIGVGLGEADAPEGYVPPIEHDLSNEEPGRAHLYVSRTSWRSDAPGAPPVHDLDDPWVGMVLRFDQGGWLRSSLFAVAGVFAFLLISLPFVWMWGDSALPAEPFCIELGERIVRDGPVMTRLQERACGDVATAGSTNTDPAALTIGIVGVVSFAVIRYGEHAYTARLVRLLRYVALGATVLPFAAAWLLVFPGLGIDRGAEWSGALIDWGWFALTFLAGLALLVMVKAYRNPASPSDAATSQPGGTTTGQDEEEAGDAEG